MKKISLILTLLLWLIIAACNAFFPDEPEPENILAGPLPDLTPNQMSGHIEGDREFARVFSEEEGLGPVFVSHSCESCHIGDGKGHGLNTLTRFGIYSSGSWDPLTEKGGPQLQQFSIPGYSPEEIPAEATGITRLMAPAVTGLGFLEAVPDQTIIDLSDPMDLNGDGISGKVAWVDPPDFYKPGPGKIEQAGKYIGRFGKKAGSIDLFHQTIAAYQQDMGITSDFLPEDLYNVQVGAQTGDNVPDPEIPASTVHNVAFYLRTLKAPERRDSENPEVVKGEKLFLDIGCAKCHTPELQTGNSDIAALHNKTFYPYSDMLLHYMGPELDDGYYEGAAINGEWRTPPLWGIGLASESQGGRAFYMHDGRTSSLEEAILLHGGEAAQVKTKFEALSEAEKELVIKFLNSL